MPTAERAARTRERNKTSFVTPVMSISPKEETALSVNNPDQTKLKLPVARRVKITVPQARALAAETAGRMLDMVKKRKDEFRESLQWLSAGQEFQDGDDLIQELLAVKEGFNRSALQRANTRLRADYNAGGTYHSEMKYPDVDGIIKTRTTNYLEKFFASEIKDLDIPVPSQDTIFNRILVSTIALNTTSELMTFQNQLIAELSPRLGDLLLLGSGQAA